MASRTSSRIGGSDELLELAQEAGRVGIFEWQVQAGTMRLSPKFLSLYGLAEFDGRYESWLNCIFREDRPRVVHILENAFAEKIRELQAEFRVINSRDGGLCWMEARNIVFYDADGEAVRVVGVHVDVTERKRSLVELRAFTEALEDAVRERTRQLEAEHEARRRVEASLRQAQKMEAVGQLTGGIAHDFNNLLTVVLGGLDIIEHQVAALAASPARSRIQQARQMAVDGALRAATLTSRLLAFSRQQPLDPQPLDANKLVAGMSELLRRTLDGAIALETVLAGGLWRTYADSHQLENAILNLALNARDAMPNGGKLTLETANCTLDATYVADLVEPVQPGQYVLIAVADTGTGMPKAALERAFEPFFTTKEVGKGSGLGLSQVYGFVRQSAGHVRIYSEVGEGTMVKIYLPRRLGLEPQRSGTVRLSEPSRAIGTETVLVVEDDEALRAYAADLLTDLGYRALQAPTGADALEILEREESIDLLFTDVVMPGGMNGRQLADEAVRRWPQLRVLFTTGYTRNAIIHHGRLDAGVHLIGKPFGRNDLSAKIREVLDRAA